MSTTDITTWLIARVEAYGTVEPDTVATTTPLSDLGLDSVFALTLCGDIEDEYRFQIDPQWLTEFGTVDELAHGISARAA